MRKNATTAATPAIWQKFWFHLLLILLICVGLYILFFGSLGWITRHGQDATVPKITGKSLDQAMHTLEAAGFDVVVDSVYEPDQKSLLVVRQSPDPGDLVKEGRTLFLTVTKVVPPTTPMPNLLNLSFRSAVLILKNSRLELGDTTFRPDIAKGAILEMSLNGVILRPGQMVPQGSKINLVIGGGLGNTEIGVPDVTGMSYPEAVALLSGSGLQYVPVWEGVISDSSTAVIYMQTPENVNEMGAPTRIREGDFIDIHIRQDALQEDIDSIKKSHRYVPEGPSESAVQPAAPAPVKPLTPARPGAIETGKNTPSKPTATPAAPPVPGGKPLQKETVRPLNPQRP